MEKIAAAANLYGTSLIVTQKPSEQKFRARQNSRLITREIILAANLIFELLCKKF